MAHPRHRTAEEADSPSDLSPLIHETRSVCVSVFLYSLFLLIHETHTVCVSFTPHSLCPERLLLRVQLPLLFVLFY